MVQTIIKNIQKTANLSYAHASAFSLETLSSAKGFFFFNRPKTLKPSLRKIGTNQLRRINDAIAKYFRIVKQTLMIPL